jgi:hypothetical protein
LSKRVVVDHPSGARRDARRKIKTRSQATLDAIRRALEAEGIEFLQTLNGQGVRLRRC